MHISDRLSIVELKTKSNNKANANDNILQWCEVQILRKRIRLMKSWKDEKKKTLIKYERIYELDPLFLLAEAKISQMYRTTNLVIINSYPVDIIYYPQYGIVDFCFLFQILIDRSVGLFKNRFSLIECFWFCIHFTVFGHLRSITSDSGFILRQMTWLSIVYSKM